MINIAVAFMKAEINTLTSELFLYLYESVGWVLPIIQQVDKALNNSAATFTVYENNNAVGMVRLIGNGNRDLQRGILI